MRFLRIALLLLPALPAACFAQRQKPAQPNILLVTIDTLRADHVGAYGYNPAETKNLDGLATEGFRFTNAYAVAPITLPSHASIMTGAYPMLTGMHDFSGNKLSASQPTLAGSLKQAGYATGAVIGAAVLDS